MESLQTRSVTFFVAIDGSEASEMAYQTIAKDVYRKDDQIVIGHISDKKKDYLPWNQKPAYIMDQYEAKCLMFNGKARYATREITPQMTNKECLWELAKAEKASIIVVGNHGRKGPKRDETIAGSAIQYVSTDITFPVMILKDHKPRTQKPDGCLRYGVCYDGSAKSKKALEIVLSIMKPTDKLTTITVKEAQMDSRQFENGVRSEATKYGVSKYEAVFLEHEQHKSVYQIIKKYLKYQAQDIGIHGYIDFVAVGNQGMNFASHNSEKFLGSVANAILRAKKMNCIFVA